MTTKSPEGSRRNLWRAVFILLVMIPFLPDIVIAVAVALARLVGCHPDQENACLIGIGGLPVNKIITLALQAGAGLFLTAVRVWGFTVFYGAVVLWLVACYVVLTLGWTRKWSRLLLGFAVALVFAVFPYFGPWLAIQTFTHVGCQPNTLVCKVFGGYVETPNRNATADTVRLGWLFLFGTGAALAFGIFAIYAIGTVIMTRKSPRGHRPHDLAHRPPG